MIESHDSDKAAFEVGKGRRTVMVRSSNATTLGEVVNDRARGRSHESEITVYKAMGIAMEDMVAANLAYRSARRSGTGASVDW